MNEIEQVLWGMIGQATGERNEADKEELVKMAAGRLHTFLSPAEIGRAMQLLDRGETEDPWLVGVLRKMRQPSMRQ